VGDGALLYGNVKAEIKIYTSDILLLQSRRLVIAFQGDYLTLVFDKEYFNRLLKSKFKSAFYGACTIQVVRYILQEVKRIQEFSSLKDRELPCIPSHKPEVAQFFYRKMKRDSQTRKQVTSSYDNFIAQAILRGGFDLREFEVDKEALRFVPIDDVLSAHAVDVEMCENVFIAAERVNRIRALHHYYETDLTKWDGSEIQIDLF
jgi:hypothetical protein